jgi:hypothetical protein
MAFGVHASQTRQLDGPYSFECMNFVMACDMSYLMQTLVAISTIRKHCQGQLHFLIFVRMDDQSFQQACSVIHHFGKAISNFTHELEPSVPSNSTQLEQADDSLIYQDGNTRISIIQLDKTILEEIKGMDPAVESNTAKYLVSLRMRFHALYCGSNENLSMARTQAYHALQAMKHFLWMDSDILVRNDLRGLYQECMNSGMSIASANFKFFSCGQKPVARGMFTLQGGVGFVPLEKIDSRKPDEPILANSELATTCASGGIVFWDLSKIQTQVNMASAEAVQGLLRATEIRRFGLTEPFAPVLGGPFARFERLVSRVTEPGDIMLHCFNICDEYTIDNYQLLFPLKIKTDRLNTVLPQERPPPDFLAAGTDGNYATYYFSTEYNCRSCYVQFARKAVKELISWLSRKDAALAEKAGRELNTTGLTITTGGHLEPLLRQDDGSGAGPTYTSGGCTMQDLRDLGKIALGDIAIIHWDREQKPWLYDFTTLSEGTPEYEWWEAYGAILPFISLQPLAKLERSITLPECVTEFYGGAQGIHEYDAVLEANAGQEINRILGIMEEPYVVDDTQAAMSAPVFHELFQTVIDDEAFRREMAQWVVDNRLLIRRTAEALFTGATADLADFLLMIVDAGNIEAIATLIPELLTRTITLLFQYVADENNIRLFFGADRRGYTPALMQRHLTRLVNVAYRILADHDEERNIVRTVAVGLLENLTFGGFCAQGFRNRLLADLTAE